MRVSVPLVQCKIGAAGGLLTACPQPVRWNAVAAKRANELALLAAVDVVHTQRPDGKSDDQWR